MRFFIITALLSTTVGAYTFKDAVKTISSHEYIGTLEEKSKSLESEGYAKGSWGDPMFKVAAKNFPKDSLSRSKTPMTGIEFGISKKIALTTKYGNIEDAFLKMSESKSYMAQDRKSELVKSLWMIVIEKKKLKEEIKIIKENQSWIKKILKVTQKLYSNGKVSQQALLDIQIRKSELDADLSNKVFDQDVQDDLLSYLLGSSKGKIDMKSVSWSLLDSKSSTLKDMRQLSMESVLQAKGSALTAKKLNYIPDLTVSFGYTKRANIDGNGDFVSASMSFPLPFSGKKYSEKSKAVFDKMAAHKNLRNYKLMKSSQLRKVKHEIEKISRELLILSDKTIKFAESSRSVTSKSYGLGSSTYVELLLSELKLQKLLLKRVILDAKLNTKHVLYKYIIGDKLYE